ncbi:MAG: fluoride efflux transporter CrcB [Flavobacteriaceae bacterium]
MKNIFYIFLGGGLGSILRYAISKLFMADKSSFPWSTLIANFIGCFIIGIVLGWFINNKQYSDLYVFLSIGFCGGLTTFSTFSVEGLTYLKNGDFFIFITYLLFSIIGSILLAALGYYIYQLGNS